VTLYQIEVRAISERYDVQAHQVAREILQLPGKHLPSLTAISASTAPLTIRTAQLYYLTGNLAPSQIDQLTQQLLIDPAMQTAEITQETNASNSDHIIDIFFHPGVTDTLAESVLTGASMLGIASLEHVETGRRYIFDKRLSEDEVRIITEALLYNPVIQNYVLQGANVGARFITHTSVADQQARMDTVNRAPTSIPLSGMTGQQLLELSKTGLLALSLDEMRAIQQHYQEQGREPTAVELETLAQTWSEHCSHKTFKAVIRYRELDSKGNVVTQETINGLLKQYIMRATQQLNRPWVVSAFSDNAGIVRFTESRDIAFKVETHNHPSAIEPFGGANTGVGGVIRDVLGVSAQPIACTDILCFGPPDTSTEELPAGVLSPHRIASGVVNGVRDYGNKMGIPTVNGAVLYHEEYMYNPLVFCGCLGILPHGSHPRQVQPGDKIVVLGGRTGRDGIHGATFSSGEMSSEINARAGSAVQIGAPITEKKVADVIIQARDRQLYTSITDCGAGGFSSAVGEMAAETGAHVELEKVLLKYQGLAPWEIWLSEAQERMVLAVPPEKLDELLEICVIEEVEASIIGRFTADHRLVVSYHGQIVADMDMAFLHDGRPERALEAVWVRDGQVHEIERGLAPARLTPAPLTPIQYNPTLSTPALSIIARSFADTLLDLLSHPTIASKESIVRRYDHEVQGATVLKPLVGKSGNGPGDAAALQPILDEQIGAGIILSNGINPLYSKIDPYYMAINAVDEALRNLTAVGGDIERAAILDNFCWGNPTDPLQLGMLVRAVKGCHDAAIGYGTPFISGKDSLNNEYRSGGERLPVIPTLLISAVGVIDDAAQTIDMSLKQPGNLLYQIGVTRNELAGSHYAMVVQNEASAHGLAPARGARPIFSLAGTRLVFPTTTVPHVNIEAARTIMKALGSAIRRGLVEACHDLSEGGLAVAAAEMSLAGLLGMTIDVGLMPMEGNLSVGADSQDALNTLLLFSESASRFLVEVAPEQQGAFESHLRINGVQDFARIGAVNQTERFVVQNGDQVLIDIPVGELQEAWKGGQA
jgi:phosphoribosylformylglycinamidine synthase subunit PurSL